MRDVGEVGMTRAELLELLKKARKQLKKYHVPKDEQTVTLSIDTLEKALSEQPQIVRCKDCKHRPKEPDWETYEDGGDIEFPDGKCPCQCSSDRYYSWYPDDDWFCADGERQEGR